jgi:hypothetical protein
MVVDNEAVSASAPLIGQAIGYVSGTAVASIVAGGGADREGYTLTLTDNGVNTFWTLRGKIDGIEVLADKKDSDLRATGTPPAGTTWTVDNGKVRVVITQGVLPFSSITTIRFTTFKSHSTGGKKNEITLGAYSEVKGDASDVP